MGNVQTPAYPTATAPVYPPVYPAAGGPQAYGYPAGPGMPIKKGDDNRV